MEIGQVVFSKCGRDKGQVFVVISVMNDYVYLVDGQLRLINKPKKKKAIHIQPTNIVVCVKKAGGLTDADIYRKLLPFK